MFPTHKGVWGRPASHSTDFLNRNALKLCEPVTPLGAPFPHYYNITQSPPQPSARDADGRQAFPWKSLPTKAKSWLLLWSALVLCTDTCRVRTGHKQCSRSSSEHEKGGGWKAIRSTAWPDPAWSNTLDINAGLVLKVTFWPPYMRSGLIMRAVHSPSML